VLRHELCERVEDLARLGAGVALQRGNAISAARIAIAVSAFVPAWNRPTTSRRSAGFRLSKVCPDTDSTHSPAMNNRNVGVLSLEAEGTARAAVSVMRRG
jgi:hypothetical protein